MFRSLLLALIALPSLLAQGQMAAALDLETMHVDRWAKLREVERYQLKIAEEYYNKKEWKVALSEYDKFLTLYERSEGAPYALYKWALCQRNLRHVNTAIKEGFQSVIDYWPDSHDAIRSAYQIARSYRAMGEIQSAKKAYGAVLEKHPDHLVAVHSLNDLIEISDIQQDEKTKVKLWKQLAFDTERNRETGSICHDATLALAKYQVTAGAVSEAVETLRQSFGEDVKIPHYLVYFDRHRRSNANYAPIYHLARNEETKLKAQKIADETITFIRSQIPADLTEDEADALARELLYLVATVHSYAQRPSEVPKIYDEIAKRCGTDDQLLLKLAGWYKSIDRWEEARATYRKMENKIEGENQVAQSYIQQDRIDEAIAIYRKLAAEDPEREAHWTEQVASTYRGAKKYAEAIKVYEELLKLDAERSDSWRGGIAECYSALGKYEEAIANYRLHSNFPWSRERMAGCFRALKQYDEAIGLYSQVASAEPSWASRMMLQVAHTQRQAGRKEAAIKAYQLVCKNFPKSSDASNAHNMLQDEYKITVTLGGGKEAE